MVLTCRRHRQSATHTIVSMHTVQARTLALGQLTHLAQSGVRSKLDGPYSGLWEPDNRTSHRDVLVAECLSDGLENVLVIELTGYRDSNVRSLHSF